MGSEDPHNEYRNNEENQQRHAQPKDGREPIPGEKPKPCEGECWAGEDRHESNADQCEETKTTAHSLGGA